MTDLFRLRRSKHISPDLKEQIKSTDYSSKIPSIERLQAFVRLIMAKRRFNFIKAIGARPSSKYGSKWKQHLKLYKGTKSVDCELMRRLGYLRIEIASMDKYLSMQYDDFDQKWAEYEKQLHKYLTEEKQFEDWHETKDDYGNTFWINHKTLKKSKHHPGIKSFKINKQKLKQEAEEEQQIQIGIVEHVRKRFNKMIPALMEHRSKEAKDIRTAIFRK